MAEDIDINREYEKIFGKESRENIFSSDDEEYQALRQSIIEAKREFVLKRYLPFDGVKIYPYDDFLRNEIVREAESKGYRIFYIKKYVEDKLSVYAAGYFYAKDSRFVVLKGTFFTQTEYFKHLTKHLEPFARIRFINNFQYNKSVLTLKRNWMFDSASLAASYILGRKITFKEWRDNRNKTLDAYYAKYKTSNIGESENKTFPDYVPPVHSLFDSPNIQSQNGDNIPSVNSTTPARKISAILVALKQDVAHLFFIKKNSDPTRFCDVSGTYDKTTQKFIMKAGSVLSFGATPSYNFTPQGIARRNFLNKFCTKEATGFRLKNDYLFDSPSAAASFSIGSASNGWQAWKDKNGNTLADVYR